MVPSATVLASVHCLYVSICCYLLHRFFSREGNEVDVCEE